MSKIFSTEDGNLNSSIRVVKEREYSDIDLSLGARTSTDGDVFRKTDAASVKQAVKNLIMTNRFEKPYRPNYGANLGGMLFELMSEDVGEEIVKSSIDLTIPMKALPLYSVLNPAEQRKIFETLDEGRDTYHIKGTLICRLTLVKFSEP